MRAVALVLLGVLIGLAARPEQRSSTQVRKARETHKFAIERPRSHPH